MSRHFILLFLALLSLSERIAASSEDYRRRSAVLWGADLGFRLAIAGNRLGKENVEHADDILNVMIAQMEVGYRMTNTELTAALLIMGERERESASSECIVCHLQMYWSSEAA